MIDAVLFDWGHTLVGNRAGLAAVAAALGIHTVQAAWFRREESPDGIRPDLVADDPLDILEWLPSIRS